MADRILYVDDVTGKYKRGASPASFGPTGFIDEDFDVTAPGGQVDFVTGTDFTVSNKLDVYVNGIKQRPGAAHDYTRNDSTNTITFNYTVPQNAWVQIRII